MCNDCNCENSYMCSIVGNIPIGFCCPKCNYYEGEHTCSKSRAKAEASIKSKAKQIAIIRSAFGVSDKDIDSYP